MNRQHLLSGFLPLSLLLSTIRFVFMADIGRSEGILGIIRIFLFISSPEPLGSQGELIAWP